MTGEVAVLTRIQAIAAVTALVAARVYQSRLPQSPTYPCVLVQLITERTGYHLRGEDRLKGTLVQVDALAHEVSGVDPYALAVTVADAIHGDGSGSGLSGFVGAVGGSPESLVLGLFREERRKYYDPDERRVVHVSQDYRVNLKP